MSTLRDLLHRHAVLDAGAVMQLQRLVAEWQLIADLSFADLLLWVASGDDLLCVAQVRPTTAPTSHPDDLVGARRGPGTQFPMDAAWSQRRIVREGDPEWSGETPVRREAVPVSYADAVVASLSRDTNLSAARSPSALELAYLSSGDDLCQMVAAGLFPASDAGDEPLTGPRAGDGLIRLDAVGAVDYASPNALSAYRRMGVPADLTGANLASLTRSLVTDSYDGSEVAARVRAALDGRSPLRIEVEARGAIVLFRILPLRPPGAPPGALVLVRDVTDLRRRDRQLLSKDATIREIHHRVKNNLQTVAALLRLQARRMSVPAARFALQESVRRVSSIALVHETLAISLDESVDFDGIVDRLVPTVTELAGGPGGTVVRRQGSFGILPAECATPLVVVLTELLHNAVEHAFDAAEGQVVLRPSRDAGWLIVVVDDDGTGLPAGFSLEASDGLGLQIVRTLVESELGGTIKLGPGPGGGTRAALRIPLVRARG
ncbi:MAG: histidine kinase N-terminal domain-containing protein [Geodermatophilaceae bacterium]|nr:histidine kinase N-terminal domain-containing protein [Geodermatophilaceae bacterium]